MKRCDHGCEVDRCLPFLFNPPPGKLSAKGYENANQGLSTAIEDSAFGKANVLQIPDDFVRESCDYCFGHGLLKEQHKDLIGPCLSGNRSEVLLVSILRNPVDLHLSSFYWGRHSLD